MSDYQYPTFEEDVNRTSQPTMLHVVRPLNEQNISVLKSRLKIGHYEAETYFTHGAREVQYDSFSESHYSIVPYQGRYVVRQDFGTKTGKGKARDRNFFEKFLMCYYRCLWSGVHIPLIIGVSTGDMDPCFIIYDYDSIIALHDVMHHAQQAYKELPQEQQVTGESMWRSLTERHNIVLGEELIESQVVFVPEGLEAKLRDWWTNLRDRLDIAISNTRQRGI